jgi:hypothetical protein
MSYKISSLALPFWLIAFSPCQTHIAAYKYGWATYRSNEGTEKLHSLCGAKR